MDSWEPVDIHATDRDEIGEEGDEWGDDIMNDLEKRFEELRQFNATLKTSSDMEITHEKDKLKEGTKNCLQIKYMIR